MSDEPNRSRTYRVHLDDPYGVAVGEVSVAGWDATAFRIVSPKSFPPGARLTLTLLDGEAPVDPTLRFRMKVHRSRRDDRGNYEISGGLMDLRREANAALFEMTGRKK